MTQASEIQKLVSEQEQLAAVRNTIDDNIKSHKRDPTGSEEHKDDGRSTPEVWRIAYDGSWTTDPAPGGDDGILPRPPDVPVDIVLISADYNYMVAKQLHHCAPLFTSERDVVEQPPTQFQEKYIEPKVDDEETPPKQDAWFNASEFDGSKSKTANASDPSSKIERKENTRTPIKTPSSRLSNSTHPSS